MWASLFYFFIFYVMLDEFAENALYKTKKFLASLDFSVLFWSQKAVE